MDTPAVFEVSLDEPRADLPRALGLGYPAGSSHAEVSMRWHWETAEAEWGVELDDAGVLRWWGSDKPRPEIPRWALGGGGCDQPVEELLAGRAPAYKPPPAILEQIMAAARAWADKHNRPPSG